MVRNENGEEEEGNNFGKSFQRVKGGFQRRSSILDI